MAMRFNQQLMRLGNYEMKDIMMHADFKNLQKFKGLKGNIQQLKDFNNAYETGIKCSILTSF